MPSIQSVVEAISIKPLGQPDQYGNAFRASLKLGEQWYSYGSIKKEAINVKTGGEWVQLLKGMEVEFMYDVNGDWSNIKKQSFTITNADGGEKVSIGYQNVTKRATQSRAPSQASVNPAEVGQCLNLAVQVGKATGPQLLDPEFVKESIRWYKEVRDLFTTLYPTITLEEAPKKEVKKEASPAPDYDAGLDMDDDI